jgi:hypothetical protein
MSRSFVLAASPSTRLFEVAASAALSWLTRGRSMPPRPLRQAQGRRSGGVALLIDAKIGRPARWYKGYGALAMEDAPLKLVLPLAVAADALRRGILCRESGGYERRREAAKS